MKNMKMKDRSEDRFGGYYLSCNGDRRLINLCKKKGLETFNPVGEWNGFGYEKFPMAVKIPTIKELKIFNSAVKEIESAPKAEPKTEEELTENWCRRLSKLTGIQIEEARAIAEEKIKYKTQKLYEMYSRQSQNSSRKRAALIGKMERENPLRRIESEDHARAIIAAHNRHTRTGYESFLANAHELEAMGEIERGTARDHARETVREQLAERKAMEESRESENAENEKKSIALNPETSGEILAELSNDQDFSVRRHVARNPNTPLEVLIELAKDQDHRVRGEVATSPRTPLNVLSDLAKDQDYAVRRTIAENKNTPLEILTDLAKDEYWSVRRNVAENPNTSAEILTYLAKDQDNMVRDAAKENLTRKQAAEDAEMSM